MECLKFVNSSPKWLILFFSERWDSKLFQNENMFDRNFDRAPKYCFDFQNYHEYGWKRNSIINQKKTVNFVILTLRMKSMNFQSLNFTFKKELFISLLNWRFLEKKTLLGKTDIFWCKKKVANRETVDSVQTYFWPYFESFLNNLDWESQPVDENLVLKNDAYIFSTFMRLMLTFFVNWMHLPSLL